MKRIEEGGNVYFEWEPHEEKIKQAFERVVFTPDLDDLIQAMIAAQGIHNQQRLEAWRQVYKIAGIDATTYRLQYSHISQRMRVLPKDQDGEDFLV